MSQQITTHLAWQHHDTGLQLRTAGQCVPLPTLIAKLLLDDGGHGLTDDPAIDLLRLEQDLRRYARHLATEVADAAEEVAYARDEITLAEVEHGIIGRRHRRTAANQLADAITSHTTWVDRHEAARNWINLLRQFIINAAVPDGFSPKPQPAGNAPPTCHHSALSSTPNTSSSTPTHAEPRRHGGAPPSRPAWTSATSGAATATMTTAKPLPYRAAAHGGCHTLTVQHSPTASLQS